MHPRFTLMFPAALCLLLLLVAAPAASAKKESLTRVTSKNFTLVGNASEREIREVAARLEQFRHAFSLFSAKSRLSSGVPVTVVVFKDDLAFRPFKPVHGGAPAFVAGYFAAGPEASFIALTAEHRDEDPYAVIFHEYAHLLVRNQMQNTPAWLNEGLAEYYSTFEMTDGNRRVWLGRAIGRHVRYLRGQRFIPLRQLLALDNTAQLHDERERQGTFYAQSWALVHYLLHGGGERRREQFDRYRKMFEDGSHSGEDAFRRAFGVEPETLEGELRQYVERHAYPAEVIRFDRGLEFDSEMRSAPLGEAEWQAHLGDLLLHIKRFDAAEEHLRRALTLDPDLAYAHAALGMLRIKQDRADEAVKHFERAVASGTHSYLAHYYHALALAGVAGDGERWLIEHTPERAEKIRAELNRSIALAPEFAPAYELLALVNLVTGERIDESIALIKRAAEIAPGRAEHTLTLAQLYARKKDYSAARALVAPLAAHTGEAQIRARSRALLDVIEAAERAERERKNSSQSGDVDAEVSLDYPSASTIRKPAEGESQATGLLLNIECPDAGGVRLRVQLDDGRTLRLHKSELRRITFVTYTTDMKHEIACGARTPPNRVLVTYRPTPPEAETRTPVRPASGRRAPTPPPAKTDGEAVAVDFIPKDWK